MAASGDLVDIRFQAEPRYQKPIGIYWLQALAVKAIGEDPANPIWPYRLPSLLGAIGAVLATYLLGKTVLDAEAGLMAALLLASSLLFNIEARLATAEAILLCVTTLALACVARCHPLPMGEGGQPIGADRVRAPTLGEKGLTRRSSGSPTSPIGRGYVLLFWLSLAAGILLKGPLILLVIGLAILCAGHPLKTVKTLQPAWGVPLLLALIAPWFILITLRSNQDFWIASLGQDLGRKIVSGQESHGFWPGTYLLELPLAFWPASPLVLAALPFAWIHRRQPEICFLLAAIVPCWLVFEAVPTKLPHYVLPLYAPLAVLTVAALQKSASPFWRRARRYRRWWLAGLAGLALLAYGVGFGLALPRLSTLFVMRAFVQHRLAYPADLQTGTVALAGFHEPSAVLWLGPETQLLSGPAAAQALASGKARLALIGADEEAAFASGFTAIDTLDGYNYAGGHAVRLTVYRRN
jgi:4-amino-4-deoxy-L-arabinose transferase-like glycosyltransferase